MQSAELIGINELELRGFLKVLPNIWNSKTRFFESGIELMTSNFADTETLLITTHLFSVSTGFMILFTEFLKDIGAATFKIYGYRYLFAGYHSFEIVEMRLRDIIMEHSDKDMSSFREIINMKIFVCPMCNAQYAFRSLKIRDDGLFQCQNCGKFVSAKEAEPESKTQPIQEDMDESERLV